MSNEGHGQFFTIRLRHKDQLMIILISLLQLQVNFKLIITFTYIYLNRLVAAMVEYRWY